MKKSNADTARKGNISREIASRKPNGRQNRAVRGASKALLCAALPLLIIVCVILAVEVCAADEGWLRKEYTKLDINSYTGMSTDDQCAAFMRMVDYMRGRVDTMDIEVTIDGERVLMYNESENAHMVDVRRLYSGVMTFKWAVLAFAAAAFAMGAIVLGRELGRFLPKAYLISFFSVLGAFAALGIWAAVDFDSFWRVFHIVFLDLESSTFDPLYSRMIRICPAELFQDMVIRIFSFGLGIPAVAAVLSGVALAVNKRRAAKNRKTA